LEDIYTDGDDDLGDFIDDDTGGFGHFDRKRSTFQDEDDREFDIRSPLSDINTSCTLQRSFQPGSTPWKNKRKYLAFNMTGVIYTIDQDSQSTVHIEYFDKSIHKDHHFIDHYQYSMGCLGSVRVFKVSFVKEFMLGLKGSLFACKSSNGNPSTLCFKPISSWGTKSDWFIQLSEGEDIEGYNDQGF
jgi:chromosome transmission fidelity protein 4